MRERIVFGLAIALSVVSLGAAQGPNSSGRGRTQTSTTHISPNSPTPRKRAKGRRPYEVGTASWYGVYFHGKATASGEPYNMFDLTAAHPSLPIGTWVRVTNLRNGRWVVVRINDRGPIIPGRIIDLSYGTALALELKTQGIQQVRLDIVQPETIAWARTVAY